MVLSLIALGVGHRAPFVRQDNSPETFFSANAAARSTYERMVATFGGDEIVLVQLGGARIDRVADLIALRDLGRELAALPRVSHVLSAVQSGPGSAAEDLSADEPPEPEQLVTLRAELQALSFYRELGLYRQTSALLGVAALVVMDGPRARPELAKALDALAARYRKRGYETVVASLATANAAIDRETRRSMSLFMPLVVVLTLVLGFALFRDLKAVVALFLPVGATVAVGVGGLELAGETLNLVTGVMPPLVLAVGFAGAIHIVSHYANCCIEEGGPTDQAIRRTWREKFIPTAFAFGTTALGFGSLALSEVRAVQVLGIAAAATLLVALFFVSLGTPALLTLLRPRLASPPHRHRVLEDLAHGSLRFRPLVLLLAAVALVFALFGVRRIEASFNGFDLLAKDAPERVAYQRLERAGIGLGNIDVWLHLPLADRKALLPAAKKLAALATELTSKERIAGTMGVHDLLEVVGYRLNKRAEVPASLAALDIVATKEARAELERSLRLYWHPKAGLKLTLLTITADGPTVARREALVRAAVARHFPGVPMDISGHFSMLLGTPTLLIRTLAESLGLSALVVALLFLVFFRSLWLVAAGMIANLLPVCMALGAMGWLGISMDVASVMTGSVAFGLAVDGTFHYLYHRKKSGSVFCAARIAGQGIVANSIVIAGSFCVLALSGFDPVMRFGLLTAFAIALALVADALLLPALIGRVDEKRRC